MFRLRPMTGMRDHQGEKRFEPSPRSAGAARRYLRAALESEGVADPPLETAILLASELVTNAFLHTRTEVVVHYSVEPSLVRVDVTDGDPTRPIPRVDAPSDATSGRGLAMVGALAQRWGVDAAAGGKSTWFQLPITETGSEADGLADE